MNKNVSSRIQPKKKKKDSSHISHAWIWPLDEGLHTHTILLLKSQENIRLVFHCLIVRSKILETFEEIDVNLIEILWVNQG